MTLADLGARLGALLERKNAAYGSAFAKAGPFLRILWPEGVPPEALDVALVFARVFDKMMRIATAPDAFGESPALDAAGYFLLLAFAQGRDVEGVDLPDVALASDALQRGLHLCRLGAAAERESAACLRTDLRSVADQIEQALEHLRRPVSPTKADVARRRVGPGRGDKAVEASNGGA